MQNEREKGTGLQILPENPGHRPDILASRILGAVAVEDLPTKDFDVAKPLVIKDQFNLDFCTGFAASEITEDQEGIEMDPLFQFAAAKRVMGEFKSWGADLRSAGMGLVTYGSLPQNMAPYVVGQRIRDFLANWANYPDELWQKAKEHKKLTMIFVDGPHDLFDNIRSVMWLNKAEKRSVMLGVEWRKSWTNAPDGVIPAWTKIAPGDSAGGHCIKGFGQKTINGEVYIKIQNSWGKEKGDKGIYYFPRSVVNKEFGPYGQITFKDMDPEEAHEINDNPTPVPVPTPTPAPKNFLQRVADALLEAFKKLFGIK